MSSVKSVYHSLVRNESHRQFVRKTVHRFFEMINDPVPEGRENIAAGGNYAPWLNDGDFMRTYESIRNNTLVDKYRLYELWQLVGEVSRTVDGALLEVGSWRGGSGAIMAEKARLCGISESVYLCDTFTGVVKASDKDNLYTGNEHADASVEDVEQLASDLKLDKIKILKGIFPEETSNLIEEASIRFCHIDVDVYQSTRDVIDWVWDRMPVGGVIVYDDYGAETTQGVTLAVDEERNKPGRVVIYNLNGHAVEIKTA